MVHPVPYSVCGWRVANRQDRCPRSRIAPSARRRAAARDHGWCPVPKQIDNGETPPELGNPSLIDLTDAIESALVGQTRQEIRTDRRFGPLGEVLALEIPLCGGVQESLLPTIVGIELEKVGKWFSHQNPEGKLLYDEAIADLKSKRVIEYVEAGADTACLSRFGSGGKQEVREPVYRLADVDLARIASDFDLLAGRFQEYADRAVKPEHLSADLQDSAVRAGRLLQKAAGARAIERDPWWRAATARPRHRRFESHADRFRWLWRAAVGLWLVKQNPHEFRNGAAGFDWAEIATDNDGRPVGKDGEPLTERRYLNGVPLSDDSCDKPPTLQPGDVYEQRLEGEFVFREDSYDEADWLKRQRDRAEVYEDACRLLAKLIDTSHASADEQGADEIGAGRSKSNQPPVQRRWTERELNEAIREYRSKRASRYDELVKAVEKNRAGAKKAARKLFGRNNLARHFKCPKAMVSDSIAWKSIAAELKLHGRTPGVGRGERKGLAMTIEQASNEKHKAEKRQEAASENAAAQLKKLIDEQTHDDRRRKVPPEA